MERCMRIEGLVEGLASLLNPATMSLLTVLEYVNCIHP